jgi:uncharacterized membrane protein YagU involved in acid resistance
MLGGLAGSATMMAFQMVWTKTAERAGAKDLANKTHRHEEMQQDSTAKVANIAAYRVIGRSLDRGEKKKGGMAVHFGFGAAMGALYGALAEVAPATTGGFGTAFGTGLFVGADEVALPRLRLSKPPRQVPPEMHVLGLTSHAVYGATVEGVRRLVRRAL